MNFAPATFDHSKIKREVDDKPQWQSSYTPSDYEITMSHINNEHIKLNRYIQNHSQQDQEFIYNQVRRYEEKVLKTVKWVNKPEARVTTKFRRMQLAQKQKAVEKFCDKVLGESRFADLRINPGRAAKANLPKNVYHESDDDIEVIKVVKANAKRGRK